MIYSLTRERDGAGDSGHMSMAIWYEGGELQHEHNARPKIGVAMQVGSLYARTYQHQDWWQTTFITEILEETENYVKFRTGNSVYEWRKF